VKAEDIIEESKMARELQPHTLLGIDYLVADEWPSLGTHLSEGEEYQGVMGPAIVLSWQVQDRIEQGEGTSGFAIGVAILLHEYCHGLSAGRHGLKAPFDYWEYKIVEIATNRVAVDLILDRYLEEEWAGDAFDYLVECIEGDEQSLER
jgi:hypothetical protein